MIHRFVDLLANPTPNNPTFLYKLDHEESLGANKRQRWWLGGNLSTPTPVLTTEWSETIANADGVKGTTSWARLDSTKSYVLYAWGDVSASPGQNKIKLGTVGGGRGGPATDFDVIGAGAVGEPILWPAFNGDETRVVYARSATSGGIDYAQIRICDLDGANDTLLYSRGGATGYFKFTNLEGMLVNRQGTKVAWVDQCESVGSFANAGIYVMNIDGTGVTRVVNWSTVNFTTTDHMLGFSHDGAYLAYTQTFSGAVHIRKVTMTGTVTDLASGNYLRGQYDFQWLPDDSGVLAIAAAVYGTEPKAVLKVAAADGSGVTAVSPERRIDSSTTITAPYAYPVVNDQDDRIYWYDVATTSVVSIAADGSDYRTDHTLDGTATAGLDVNDQNFRTLYTNG